MRWIQWVPLLVFMLFSLSGIFTTTFITVGTISAVSHYRAVSSSGPTCNSFGNCCSGEYCCWGQGQSPPSCSTTSTQPTTAPAPEQPAPALAPAPGRSNLYNLGYKRGLNAGINWDGITYQECPEIDKQSEFCQGWNAGFEAGKQQRGQGQGRKDAPVQPVNTTPPADNGFTFPPVPVIIAAGLIATLIVFAVPIAVAAIGAATAATAEGAGIAAAVEAAGAAAAKTVATGIRLAGGAATATARFFGKKP